MESLPDRPAPPRSAAEAIRSWLLWFGVWRLLASAFAVVAVGGGGYWLLRPPPTPVEDSLPYATATTSIDAPPPETASTASITAESFVVVHVAGAVQSPGLYTLAATARVADAVAAAGGAAADADVDMLNLAAVLIDGERVYVPHVGEPVPAISGPSLNAPPAPIDLNHATVDALDDLPGIGPSTAAAIVEYREESGPFASVDDLLEVRGIGPAKLDAIRLLVRV